LILNFRRVLYVVCFLMGSSPASEFYMPTFRNTLSHLHRKVGIERLHLRIVGVTIREKVWLKYVVILHLPAYEDETVFRNVGIQNSDAGKLSGR
jgi:hypothetical protein